MTTPEYVSTTVPVAGDPCLTMTHLARTTRSDTHFVYETPQAWSFAAGSLAEIIVTPSRTTFRDHRGAQVVDRAPTPLAEVSRLLAQVDVPDWRAYGIATFELCHDLARAVQVDGDPVLLHLVIPRVEVRIANGRAVVRGTEPAQVTELADLLIRPAELPGHRARPVEVESAESTGYRQAVKDAVEEISDGGGLQKVILSRTVPVDIDVDLYGTFVLGRKNNNPARSFLISLGGLRAVGFSPEIVVEVNAGGQVRTQPLAGTRALIPGDAGHNERLRAELVNNAKEVFEHAISVRAAVEDLAQVCQPGSLAVREFMSVKARGTVQHLGSSVVGALHEDRGPWDALTAVFPTVTISGTPKAAACAYIREHEETPRDLYGGAVLTVDADGALDAALVLRTLFQREGRTWLRAGAGIVAQSDPDREFEETCEKLRSVALNVVGRDDAAPGAACGANEERQRLRAEIASILQLPPHEIDERQSLIEQGLDSVSVMAFASKWHYEGVTVELDELFEQPTIRAWSDLVSQRRAQR